MSDKEFVIDMEDDTEGHNLIGAKIVESGDADWLEDRLRKDSGKSRFRITLGDEDEIEGHGADGTTLRLNLVDDDDTEGHAIAVHFPSRADADAFRQRLLVTGVLVGTVALGAAGGIGLSALQSDAGSAEAGSAAVTQSGQDWQAQRQQQSGYTDPLTQSGQDWQAQRQQQSVADPLTQSGQDWDAQRDQQSAGAGSAATTQAGPMDAHEAPAFEGLSAADQAYADRLAMQAASAPAAAAATDADSDQGIMDASETSASSAPSYVDSARNAALASQAASDDSTTGAPSYVDAARAEALANQAADDDSASDSSSLKGPAPR